MAVTTFQHGRKTYVGIRVTGGGAFTNISTYVQESSLPMNREEHDTTTYDPTSIDKTFQGGNRDHTFDFKGFWNPTLAGIMAPFRDADSIDIRWGKAGNGTGAAYREASGFITKYEDPTTSSDIDGFSATMRVSGPVTDGTF